MAYVAASFGKSSRTRFQQADRRGVLLAPEVLIGELHRLVHAEEGRVGAGCARPVQGGDRGLDLLLADGARVLVDEGRLHGREARGLVLRLRRAPFQQPLRELQLPVRPRRDLRRRVQDEEIRGMPSPSQQMPSWSLVTLNATHSVQPFGQAVGKLGRQCPLGQVADDGHVGQDPHGQREPLGAAGGGPVDQQDHRPGELDRAVRLDSSVLRGPEIVVFRTIARLGLHVLPPAIGEAARHDLMVPAAAARVCPHIDDQSPGAPRTRAGKRRWPACAARCRA